MKSIASAESPNRLRDGLFGGEDTAQLSETREAQELDVVPRLALEREVGQDLADNRAKLVVRKIEIR